jgi:excisionase family DNA binding protein
MPQRIESDRVLLSTDEAGELVSVSPAYIQRLLRNGRVEGIKFGTVWRVYEDSLKAFFAQPRKRGPKGPHQKKQLVTCPNTTQTEHVGRDLRHEPDQEVNETQSSSQPGAEESRVVTE